MSAIMTMYSSSDEDVTTERRADPKGAKGSSRKAPKTRKGSPSSSLEDPFTPLSLTSDKLLQKLLQTKKRTLKHSCSRVLPSKTAATYSPTFTQYHRRGWA